MAVVRKLLQRVNSDAGAALVLGAAAVLALLWANIGGSYQRFWSITAGLRLDGFQLTMSLADWVNSGLMALFFFSVGLDVRREFSIGELQDRSRAILPIAGAAGGLLVPVGVFLLIVRGSGSADAWGSVISTDTAFALGMLAVVGPRNGGRLRVFLLALSVVDDIAALSVIAIFYTTDLDLRWLGVVAGGLVVVWLMQHRNVWRTAPYVVIGIVIWFATLRSGVDATLAGVLIALLMPVYLTRPREVLSASLRTRWYRQAPAPHTARMASRSIARSVPLNQRLSELLPPYVNFVVVPLFALANIGIPLSSDTLAAAATSRLTWGVLVGLVIGKFIGVFGGTMLARRFTSSSTPGLDGPRIAGVAALCGMGFTISLLVIAIAVPNPAVANEARIGVLAAAILALLGSFVVFRVGDKVAPLPEPSGTHLERPVDPHRDHIRGSASAPAVLLVYAAINDGYRRGAAEALADTRHRLGDDVAIVFRHHAEGDEERTAALALEAAGAQGRFWEFYDTLISERGRLSDADPEKLVARAGLDADRFARDVTSQRQQGRVDEDNQDADAAGLPDRPVIYLNGRRFNQPADSYHLITAAHQTATQQQTD